MNQMLAARLRDHGLHAIDATLLDGVEVPVPHRSTAASRRHPTHWLIYAQVGTPAQCKAAAKAYRVYSSIGAVDDENDDDYLIDHSIVLYLVGPDGKFLDFFTQATPADAIAAKLREHRAS